MSYTFDGGDQRNQRESPLSEILSREEEENLGRCIKSISPLAHIASFVIGGALCAGTCYKFVPRNIVQIVGLGGGILSMMMSRVAAIQACIRETAPALLDPKNRDILQAKLSSNFMDNLSTNTRDTRLIREVPAQIPEEPSISAPSALEFDDPVSSTQSFSDITPIPTLEEAEVPQQKKPMTYEELRKKHREEYQKEYRQRVVSRPRERASEEPRFADQPHKHRNKYGDEME